MAIDTTIKNDTLTQQAQSVSAPQTPTITVGGTNISKPQKQSMGGMDISQFAGIVDTMRGKLTENNKLADTRTKLLNVLYNRPLTKDEASTLDPSTVDLINKGDKKQIEMQIRILNDKISGRTQTLDKSVDYLTSAYEKTLLANEKAKSDAMSFIAVALKEASDVGLSPKAYMEQLYGAEKLAQLEDLTGLQFTETGAPVKRDKGFTPYQVFSATQALKKTVQKNTEAAKELNRQKNVLNVTWNRFNKGEAKDLNATTQAIISTFNKILDPLSVVREAEYDRTAQGQAFIENIKGRIDALTKGGPGLTKESLKELVDLGNAYAQNAQAYIDSVDESAREEARFFGLNPDFVVSSYVPPAETEPKKEDFKSQIIAISSEDVYNKLKKSNPDASDEELFNAIKSRKK